MALTEEEKKRIKEEELFRAKISGEISGQKKTSWKIYLITALIIWAIGILLAVWYYLLPMATHRGTRPPSCAVANHPLQPA